MFPTQATMMRVFHLENNISIIAILNVTVFKGGKPNINIQGWMYASTSPFVPFIDFLPQKDSYNNE